MASVRKVISGGKTVYRVSIRKKGAEEYKTFHNEDDAKLYSHYKESLIQNMENFDVPISERVTFKQIMDIKIKTIPEENKKYISDFTHSVNLLLEYFKGDKEVKDISEKEWDEFARYLLTKDVYRGAKTENGKRKMSASTLRRHLAAISSAFSYARESGIGVDNPGLLLLQKYKQNTCLKPPRKTDDRAAI